MNTTIKHIVPINDTHTHCEDVNYNEIMGNIPFPKCKCGAEAQFNPDVLNHFIIVHNSFDGREGIEWTNELLNQK